MCSFVSFCAAFVSWNALQLYQLWEHQQSLKLYKIYGSTCPLQCYKTVIRNGLRQDCNFKMTFASMWWSALILYSGLASHTTTLGDFSMNPFSIADETSSPWGPFSSFGAFHPHDPPEQFLSNFFQFHYISFSLNFYANMVKGSADKKKKKNSLI